MPKEFRLADGVLDLGLVKLVNLGMDPDKLQVKLEPLNNMGTNFSNIKGALYDYRLSTEYVSNFDMDCTLKLHRKMYDNMGLNKYRLGFIIRAS